MGEVRFESHLVKTGMALAKHCNEGTEAEGLSTLYAENCISVEALPGPNGQQAHGLDAIRAKHDWWNSAFEEHDSSAQGPFFQGTDRFTMTFSMDVTEKESGQRMQMSEIGEYTVDADGQITREEFFYNPADMA